MKIGFDAFPVLGAYGGVSNYVCSLLRALNDKKDGPQIIAYIPKGTTASAEEKVGEVSSHVAWKEIDRWSFSHRGQIDQLDVFHGTNFKCQTRGRFGSTVTIHDLWLDRHPEYSKKLFGQRLSFYRTRRRAQQATKVIAVSQFTASEIQDLYGIHSPQISIVYHGASKDFWYERDKNKLRGIKMRIGMSEKPYILFIGGAEPRKNHVCLFKAFSLSTFLQQHYDLVVVGNLRHQIRNIQDTRIEFGLQKHVVMAGVVTTEELRLLYSHASLFVFPSRYEGFGFPVLEAMSCGTPIVTSNYSALPEIVGDAALLVNPMNAEELRRAVQQVLTNSSLRNDLSRKGLERAKAFTWAKAASETVQVYQSLREK